MPLRYPAKEFISFYTFLDYLSHFFALFCRQISQKTTADKRRNRASSLTHWLSQFVATSNGIELQRRLDDKNKRRQMTLGNTSRRSYFFVEVKICRSYLRFRFEAESTRGLWILILICVFFQKIKMLVGWYIVSQILSYVKKDLP